MSKRLAAGLGLTVAAAGLQVAVSAPAHAAPVEVQILATNDFHGRLRANGAEAGAAVLAGAVKKLEEANPHTVFAAAGDLIGASTFESFIARDKPTIDALNSAGLDVSAVGNHEFDSGYDDLLHRVMAPYDASTNPYGGAAWTYIGANVHKAGAPESELLEPTYVRDLGGVQVGFIGAVTEHLHELVSPAGIEGVTVEEIAAATNREADRLVAAGVDVVVLLVHEGASSTDCATMDDDPSSDFGRIIHGVDDNVDAIVSGHTHLAYNCAFPVAGWAGRPVTERPVVSAGQYGTNLNKLVFSVDATSGEVQAKTQEILPLAGGLYPADDATRSIVDRAVAEADVLGARSLGRVESSYYRAKRADGTSENRGGESTLGNLVAEAQRWATAAPETGGAQIAFMNPGGLRADMVAAADGTVTYRQAATVQPFANTLVNVAMTGAQIKAALEQQWQPAGASRPFLRLGVSRGFTYTYDPAAATGAHVTGMWLDGARIVAGTTYSVTVNSFLAAGGDNFGAFNVASSLTRDTGKVDLAAMVDYLAARAGREPLATDWSQRAVGVSFPGGVSTFEPRKHVRFALSSLTFSAPADLDETAVVVSLDGRALGTFPVDATVPGTPYDEVGTAQVDVRLPPSRPGPKVLTVTGVRTGTRVEVPIQVAGLD